MTSITITCSAADVPFLIKVNQPQKEVVPVMLLTIVEMTYFAPHRWEGAAVRSHAAHVGAECTSVAVTSTPWQHQVCLVTD